MTDYKLIQISKELDEILMTVILEKYKKTYPGSRHTKISRHALIYECVDFVIKHGK